MIGNDYEMGVIKNKLNIKEKDQIGNKNQIIITTKGKSGSKIEYMGKVYEIPVVKVSSAEDPAGAGDAYRAGFMAGYMRGFPVEVSGRMGAVASAYTVEKYGTTTHKYGLEQFIRRYEDNFGEKLGSFRLYFLYGVYILYHFEFFYPCQTIFLVKTEGRAKNRI